MSAGKPWSSESFAMRSLPGQVLVGLVAYRLFSGFAVVGGKPYAVTFDEVHGDTPLPNVAAIRADESAAVDWNAASHAKKCVQQAFSVRDAEVRPVQVKVAAGRFVVDGVTEEFLVAVGLEVVVHHF
jgi:hypothetical protein